MNDKEHDLEALYGPLYPHSDFPRDAHVRYTAFDGKVHTGVIIWILEPGRTVRKHLPIRAQYVINPDEPMGMPHFVNLGDVLGLVEDDKPMEVKRG